MEFPTFVKSSPPQTTYVIEVERVLDYSARPTSIFYYSARLVLDNFKLSDTRLGSILDLMLDEYSASIKSVIKLHLFSILHKTPGIKFQEFWKTSTYVATSKNHKPLYKGNFEIKISQKLPIFFYRLKSDLN